MKRKVIQIANSTQLISLPRKWCIEHDIKRGDELEVEPSGSKIIVSTEKDSSLGSVQVNVSKLDRTSLMFLIRGLYKKGYDEIRLTYERPVLRHYRTLKDVSISAIVHREISRCPGMEVIEQKDTFCVLKAISNADPEELDHILRRTFILISDTCRDLVTACKTNNHAMLETIEEKHDNVTKFINHCSRLINKRQSDANNAHFMYNTVSMLDKVIDTLKNGARNMLKYDKKVTPTTGRIIEMVYESYETFRELFYKFSLDKVHKINEAKETIYQAITNKASVIPRGEILLLCELHQSLELYRALSESRMAMEY
jgi:phosphate uptake regulator